MRRFVSAACVVVLAAVGASCIPASPPPPGYIRPIVAGSRAEPSPVPAGSQVVVSLDVLEDEEVTGVTIYGLRTPDNTDLKGPAPCTSAIVPTGEAGNATVAVTCDVPTYATNGTWVVELGISDRLPEGWSATSVSAEAPFEVTGGTDDHGAPRLLEWSVSPSPVRADGPFTFSMRVEDDAPFVVPPSSYGHNDFYKFAATHSVFYCDDPTVTVVSATETVITQSCAPSVYSTPGPAEPGWYVANMPVGDALGHLGKYELWFEAF